MIQYCLFTTSIGTCGLSWTKRGIVGLQLPEKSKADTKGKLLSKLPKKFEGILEEVTLDKAPSYVQNAAEKVTQLLDGHKADLSHIKIDESAFSPFFKKVYALAQKIPVGKTFSYGELSAKAGSPKGARAVGQAMARNPIPLIIPCHRVLGSTSELCGFSAFGGTKLKKKLLDLESVKL